MVQITKTSDQKYQFANILIFGESGSGKTHFLGTAPEGEMIIFNVMSESGLMTLREKGIDVIDINSLKDMEEALKWLETEGIKKYRYVGIDSFSQFQKGLEKQISATGFQLWGQVKEITKELVDRVKGLPINFVALCEVSMKDDEGGIKYIPSLIGSSKDEVPYWFDEVYFFEKTGKAGEKPTYRALTNSGSKYPCKSRIGSLPIVIENPTITFVIEKLSPKMQAMEKPVEVDNIGLINRIAMEKKVLIGNILTAYQVKSLEELSLTQQIDCLEKLKIK